MAFADNSFAGGRCAELSTFLADAWGQVAIDFINAGNIGAASFAARSAATHAYNILGNF